MDLSGRVYLPFSWLYRLSRMRPLTNLRVDMNWPQIGCWVLFAAGAYSLLSCAYHLGKMHAFQEVREELAKRGWVKSEKEGET